MTRPRFGAVESDYTFTLPEGFDNVTGLDNIMEVVDRMMNNILHTVVRGYPEDRIRFVMQMDGLKSGDPISMSFMPQRELTVDRIYDMVHKVIQSGENVRLNNNFKVNVIWVDSPRSLGGGKRKGSAVAAAATGGSKKKYRNRGAGRVFNMRDYAKDMRNVINVTARDKMCLARCLVIALWREKRDTVEGALAYKTVRNKTSGRQTAEARELCVASGVYPEAYASLEDVKRFERYLNRGLAKPRYRLVLFSQSHFFTPIYHGVSSEAPVLIYLYLRDNHYHLITSMKGFLKKKHFCDKCLKAFRSFDKLKCNFVCRACGTMQCGPAGGESNECDVCHRAFKSTRCYELHFDPPPHRPRIKDSSASGCTGARRAIRRIRPRTGRTSVVRKSVRIVSARCPGSISVSCRCWSRRQTRSVSSTSLIMSASRKQVSTFPIWWWCTMRRVRSWCLRVMSVMTSFASGCLTTRGMWKRW